MPMHTRLTVRLPVDLAARLKETAAARGDTRSEVVRYALRLHLEGRFAAKRPWTRVEELAGAARGGPPDLACREPAV